MFTKQGILIVAGWGKVIDARHYGQVWKAEDSHGSLVALKFCTNELGKKTLANEIQKLKTCGEFEGVVKLHEWSLDGDLPFVVFDYIEGGDFGAYLEKRFAFPKRFSIGEAAEVIHDLAVIMGRVHRLGKIAHRDLKPANILLGSAKKRSFDFRITDFGIGIFAVKTVATKLSHSDLARGWAAGTHLYMSPEQHDPNHPGHPADDIHALGVLWYQLLVGSLKTPPPRDGTWGDALLADGMTNQQLDVLKTCLKAQNQRHQDGAILADQLREHFLLPIYHSRKDAQEVERRRSNGEDWLEFLQSSATNHQGIWNEAVSDGLAEVYWIKGLLYETGVNVKIDLTAAKANFHVAAEDGHTSASYDLALYHLYGLGGTQRDISHAIKLLAHSAGQGHPGAQFELAECYLCGYEGVAADQKKAEALFAQAAQQGHAEALFWLGEMYSERTNRSDTAKISKALGLRYFDFDSEDGREAISTTAHLRLWRHAPS